VKTTAGRFLDRQGLSSADCFTIFDCFEHPGCNTCCPPNLAKSNQCIFLGPESGSVSDTDRVLGKIFGTRSNVATSETLWSSLSQLASFDSLSSDSITDNLAKRLSIRSSHRTINLVDPTRVNHSPWAIGRSKCPNVCARSCLDSSLLDVSIAWREKSSGSAVKKGRREHSLT